MPLMAVPRTIPFPCQKCWRYIICQRYSIRRGSSPISNCARPSMAPTTERVCHGHLAKHMFSGVQGGDRLPGMQRHRGGKADGVNLRIVQHLLVIGVSYYPRLVFPFRGPPGIGIANPCQLHMSGSNGSGGLNKGTTALCANHNKAQGRHLGFHHHGFLPEAAPRNRGVSGNPGWRFR